MNPADRRPGLRRGRPARTILTLAAAAAVVVLAAAAAACGGSSGSQGTAAVPGQGGQVAPTSMQVLTKVTRGDLAQSVMAPARVKSLGGKTVVVATVPAQSASSVVRGQAATVMLFSGDRGAFPQPGASGMPQGPPPSGMPVPQGSGMPQPGAGGQGGFPGGDFAGRGTAGTVTAVVTNADGTAAATIRLDEKPADATADASGMASIQVEVLASDVIVIPTAAIKVSGGSATVEVMVNGTTETRSVEVGRQAGSQSEIVSGLSEGENIVWYRSFPGGGFPGAQGQGSSSGQSGATGQSGGGYQ